MSRTITRTGIALFMILVGVIVAFVFFRQSAPPHTAMPITHALIGDQAFYLYTPRSATERHTGLSAFSSIAPNEGMIFYGLPDDHLAIWMKDMSFAIDVIWLDHHDRIVHSEQHVTPDSYPTMYQNPPSRPASYLIELPSGTVERLSLDRGDTVTFPDR